MLVQRCCDLFQSAALRSVLMWCVLVSVLQSQGTAAAAATAAEPAEGSVVLIKDGENPAHIAMVNLPPNGPIRQTINRLLPPYMKRITGVVFPFTNPMTEEAKIHKPAIVFKLEPLFDDAGKQLPSDSFNLKTIDGRFYIRSETIVGLHYGFYEWLTRLGANFWSHTEEDLPSLKTIIVPPTDYTWVAPFKIHNIMSREAQTRSNDFANKSRSMSNLEFTGNHTLYPLLTPYAQEHPEIYPLVQAKDRKTNKMLPAARQSNKIHFCYSDPNIATYLAEALSKEVEKRNGNIKDFIYFAGMGDWYGGQCTCDRCMAIYEEEIWYRDGQKMSSGFSGSLLRMINKTAAILDEKYPGILVGTFAYMSFEMPPGKTVPAKNVVIEMPRLRHCSVHPVNACEKNANYWAGLQQWAKLAPGRVYVWEYGASFDNFLYPFPSLLPMAENIKAYHDIGIAGLDIQGNYVTTGGHAVVMNNWVWSQLMNDPSQDIDTLIAYFTDHYYGPAASIIREYNDTLQASVNTPQIIHADEFAKPRSLFLNNTVLAALREHIVQAQSKVQGKENHKYLQRVNELAIGLEVIDLWSEGKLVENEQGNRLIREDLGGDTYDRAKAVVESTRGATPREWGNGRAYWLTFMSWHGGPFADLKQGDLLARVVPSQAGGFGPVLHDGKRVISHTSVTTLRSGEFVGQPSSKQSTTAGHGGVSHWSADTKRVVEQTVKIVDDKTIQVSSSVTRVTKDKALENRSLHVNTIVDGRQMKLFYRDMQGKWHEFTDKPVFNKPIKIPGMTAWRVELPHVTYTDEYESLTAKPNEEGVMPNYNGSVVLERNRRDVGLLITLPIRDLPLNEKVEWLKRRIVVTPNK